MNEIKGSHWVVRIGAVTVGRYATEAEARQAAAGMVAEGLAAWAHYCD